MELDELHVGDLCPGPVGHGDAVAGRGVRIAGVEVDLAGPPRGQHGGAGQHGVDPPAIPIQHIGPPARIASPRAGIEGAQEINGDAVFIEGDVGIGIDLIEQRGLDLPAREVLGVKDPAARVAPFPPQVVFGFAGLSPAREPDAPVNQLPYPVRAASDHGLDDIFLAKSVPRGEGVLNVGFECVVPAHHRRDAALGIAGRRFAPILFRDQDHAAEPGCLDREGEAGDPCADDQKIRAHLHF